jgi:hypothetical protein
MRLYSTTWAKGRGRAGGRAAESRGPVSGVLCRDPKAGVAILFAKWKEGGETAKVSFQLTEIEDD